MHGKILIVDDEPHMRLLIEQSLEELADEGAEVLAAEDGARALELIESERPDLVLLDAMMPQVNGFAVCRAAKDRLGVRAVFVIMLTAKGQELDKRAAELAGVDVYMTKPFDPDALLSQARAVLSTVSG